MSLSHTHTHTHACTHAHTHTHTHTHTHRVVEAVLIVMVTTSAIFTCSMLLGTCLHKSVPGTTGSESDEITVSLTIKSEMAHFSIPFIKTKSTNFAIDRKVYCSHKVSCNCNLYSVLL